MLCPPLRPLNRRPNVPNLPDPHRARPSRAAGSFFVGHGTFTCFCTGGGRSAPAPDSKQTLHCFAPRTLEGSGPLNPSYFRPPAGRLCAGLRRSADIAH
jgi:hypothetical protein